MHKAWYAVDIQYTEWTDSMMKEADGQKERQKEEI